MNLCKYVIIEWGIEISVLNIDIVCYIMGYKFKVIILFN